LDELLGAAKAAAHDLVRRLPDPVAPLSVLEGWTEGRVFVDDADVPKAAFVWETKNNLFLAGEPEPAMVADLTRLFSEIVIPAGQRRGRPMSFLMYCPGKWSQHIPAMLPSRPPIADTRLCYEMDVADLQVIVSLSRLIVAPERCALRIVDRSLLESDGIQNLDEMRAEILKQWNSFDEFFAKGAGYCLVDRYAGDGRGAVTSWSLSEYPTADDCGIGVETVEEYRQRGHGTAVSAACVKRCVEMGYNPVWDLWQSNAASKALAEKLGFRHEATYPVFYFWYNEVDNLLVNGNVAFTRRRDPAEAAGWFARAFEVATEVQARTGSLISQPSGCIRWLKHAARACAQAGLLEQALRYISNTADEGMSTEETEQLRRELGLPPPTA
jgi:RimJ/RimL family protein N-acetyltransferase